MNCSSNAGSAYILTLIALALLSILGFYMTLSSNTGVQISDNYETQIQATYAALAGLNHAHALIRGLPLESLLRGPDGAYSEEPSYLIQVKGYDFRNPLPLLTALSLNISDASITLASDDGLISTGSYNGSNGTMLIPPAGIAFTSANPYQPGQVTTSRYFVKVTDNNGEASEIAGDPSDNPFIDGDGTVIVRSIGLSKTFSETTGLVLRRNSAAVFEARFKRLSTFDTGPPLVVIGSETVASFQGTYQISGGSYPGIGTIDIEKGDDRHPDEIIRAAAHDGNITGGELAQPSIQDISNDTAASPDKSFLLDPRFLWEFTRTRARQIADSYFEGDQYWYDGSYPYAGSYDPARAWNAPGQDPKITVVNGNLQMDGGFSGGGLLIVTGNLTCSGSYGFSGLVLVIGSGGVDTDGSGQGVVGGLVVASLTGEGESLAFGSPSITIRGSSRFVSNRDAVKTATALIPVSRTSFREIAGSDP